MLQTNLLQDLSNTVADGRSRSKRKIHNTKLNTKTFGSFPCYQLSNTCYLKCSTFDHLAKCLKILSSHFLKSSFNNTRSADTYVDDRICLCHTVERTCHKRIIIRRITEYNQLGTSQRILILTCLSCFQNDLTHQFDSVHIDTCTCRAHIYRAADTLCLCQCLWNRLDQKFLCRSHSLAYQSRITTNEVYSNCLCSLIQSLCNCHKIFFCLTCRTAHQSDRSYGNSFIYNGDPIFHGDCLTCRYQIFGTGCNLVINLFVQSLKITVNTVQKADSHCNGTHIQVLLLDHFIGFIYFKNIDHFIFLPCMFSQILCITLKMSSCWQRITTPI